MNGILQEFPRDLVLHELKDQFSSGNQSQKVSLAYALAHFNDVRVRTLVTSIETALPDEVDNLVAALRHDQESAMAAILHAAAVAKEQQLWAYRARLAVMGLHLSDPSLAREMCQLSPDPIERTAFIETCSFWHGTLANMADNARSLIGNTRSALLLAIGLIDQAQVSHEDRESWKPLLAEWFMNKSDAGTHSAAGFVLRRWRLPEPEVTVGAGPARRNEWYINRGGLTMLKIAAGSFSRQYFIRAEGEGSVSRPIIRKRLNQKVTISQPFFF